MSTRKPQKSSASKKPIPDFTHVSPHVSGCYPVPSVEVAESICYKARRLVREADEEYYASERKKVSAIIGGPAPGRDANGEYEICGHKWRFYHDGIGVREHLDCQTRYKGMIIHRDAWVYDTVSFGRHLIIADKQLALFQSNYPDTIWGNMKAWFGRL